MLHVLELLAPLLLFSSTRSLYPASTACTAKKLLDIFLTLFYDTTIQEIQIQANRRYLQKSPEERGSEDGTTLLQIFFTLSNNDIFILRLDMPHKGIPYVHLNLQEQRGNTISDSALPLTQKEYMLFKNAGYSDEFFFCSQQYWFKVNALQCLQTEAALQAKLQNIITRHKHYKIDVTDEHSFDSFIRTYCSFLELFSTHAFSKKSFGKENTQSSNRIKEIRQTYWQCREQLPQLLANLLSTTPCD